MNALILYLVLDERDAVRNTREYREPRGAVAAPMQASPTFHPNFIIH